MILIFNEVSIALTSLATFITSTITPTTTTTIKQSWPKKDVKSNRILKLTMKTVKVVLMKRCRITSLQRILVKTVYKY